MRADQFGRVRRLNDLERDVDLRRDDVLILDLGLGQRGLLDWRPHHRLGAAVQLAALGELQQLADDGGFGVVFHRQIRIGPVAHYAEPLELGLLHGHPFLGIGAAFGAELRDGDVVLVELLRAVRFLDLPLDRQAVAIPAGDVGRVLAHQRLAADDDVLQHLVHRVAHVDVAVRIRRAVMQDEPLAPEPLFAQPVVDAELRPALEDRRLLGGEARLHREVGLRQEDGVAVIAGGRRSIGHKYGALSRAALALPSPLPRGEEQAAKQRG
jgi:hypothetical protein